MRIVVHNHLATDTKWLGRPSELSGEDYHKLLDAARDLSGLSFAEWHKVNVETRQKWVNLAKKKLAHHTGDRGFQTTDCGADCECDHCRADHDRIPLRFRTSSKDNHVGQPVARKSNPRNVGVIKQINHRGGNSFAKVKWDNGWLESDVPFGELVIAAAESNPHNEMEQLRARLGQHDAPPTKREVNYRPSPYRYERCGTCSMYSHGRCSMLQDEVNPLYYCERYEYKNKK